MMRFICGILMIVGSVLGMLVSSCSQIIVNSDISILNGIHLSLGLGIFFMLSCLSGIYIIANSN
jgi:hypothetical protein